MRGKKGLTKDTLSEQVRRIAFKPSFQKKIAAIRRQLAIPQDGFDTKNAAQKWYSNTFSSSWNDHKDFFDQIDKLLTEEGLDFRAFNALQRYIITGSKSSFLLSSINLDSCEVEVILPSKETDRAIEKRWKESGRTFVRLYIPHDIGLPRVKEYLDGRWPFIRDSLLRKRKGERSIRRTRNGERDRLICHYYGLSRAELDLKKGQYKDIAVARILCEEYGYKKITREIVRTVAHRMGLLRDK